MKRSMKDFALAGVALSIPLACSLFFGCKTTESSENKSFFNRPEGRLALPENYQSLSAAEKQALLFDKEIMGSRFEGELPKLTTVNPLTFVMSHLNMKLENVTDEAPVGYVKSLHAHGVTAKVRFEAEADTPFTGLFKGVDYGIIRASLTGDPKGDDVAPGIALKFLIDGKDSQNVSALYKLTGQGANHNFFANELSNIIPIQTDPKSIFSTTVFRRASKHPTKMSVKPMAEVQQDGSVVPRPKSPVQLYFVPNASLAFPTAAHDTRLDFLKLPPNTVLYDVYATTEEGRDRGGEIDERRRAGAFKIGRLVSTSAFVASEFGDSRLFFKHHRYEDNH